MFEKVNRSGLIIYLYYNRDAIWRYYLSFQETSLLTTLCSNSRSGAIDRALGQGKVYKKSQGLSYPRAGNTLCGQSSSRGKRYHRKSLKKVLTIF